MDDKDLANALMAVGPESKAAKIRKVMPLIEEKLSAGVRRQVILDVLKQQGIELNMETLKSYLYRHRKAQRENSKPVAEPPRQEGIMPPAVDVRAAKKDETVSYDTEAESEVRSVAPLGPSELNKIMNPGDDQNSSDLAMYESAGRRKRTPK